MALDRWAVIEVIDKDGKRSTRPGNRDLDFPLTIGKEWKYDFRNRSVTGGYSDYVNGYRVEAFEDVRTKAGTFKAFRINLRQENVGSLHWTGQLDFWWSPEVRGFVKRKVYGLQHSNPVSTDVAYRGSSQAFGTAGDPMVGGRIGGVNVFGGGLALYDDHGRCVGGVGVSGDTSCRDHMVAWELRHNLHLDFVPTGVATLVGDATHPDNIIFDVNNGFGHPNCLDAAAEKAAAAALSPASPLP